LVTGAAGYIGRHVVANLLDRGAHVIATDIVTDGIDPRAEVIPCDIFTGEKDLYERLKRPDVCLHLAWKDGFVHNSDAHIENLSKHFIFIRNMVASGLGHLAVMGTMHEIGYVEGAIDETTPCNPSSMYGIAKDTLRRVTSLMLTGKPVVLQWLRAYYIYGDDERNHSIFTKLLAAEREGKEKFPFTTGKNKCDFIHIDGLADQISACVTQSEINGVINCCTGIPVSLADIVEDFIRQNGLKIKLEYGVFPERAYDSPAVWGDNTKIRQIMQAQGAKT
jgi:nucleoside-diphosphate-sugar epimerase